MLSIRKLNPMVRSIGTMGVVAGLVGVVTFAAATSNTVALSPNNITTATASLAISATTNCTTGNTTVITGFQDSSLAPGASTAVSFCLDNTGGVPMFVSATIPQILTANTAAQATTLTITCGTEGTLSTTLSAFSNGASFAFPTALSAGSVDNCTATAALSGTYATNGDTIPQFDIDFVGTQSNS